MRSLLAVAAVVLLLPSALFAQAAPPPTTPTAAAADQKRQDQLQALLGLDEPGEQMRGLAAFVGQYPHAPELAQAYAALIEDATQLNDDRGVLLYNQKLQALDPADLGQRIKVLNLLLLETDAPTRRLAAQEAATFGRLVEQKAAETPPADMGPTRWRLNVARLRSLAALFEGTAAQALGQYPAAEADLVRSLEQSQSEEAAEHLAAVYVAEAKIPQAVDTFALALALPGSTIAGRARLRAQAGALYATLHGGSQAGFGDLILRRFDEVAARDADEQQALVAADHAQGNARAASAAAFVLGALGGGTRSLADERGKVVVLDFWATWCGPCLVQHPLLAGLRQAYAKNHNVIFIAINEDEEQAKVAPFVAAQHWTPDTWLDAGLGGFLGVDSLPTTLILGPDGAVVYRQEGFIPATFATQLGQAIQSELARAFPATRP